MNGVSDVCFLVLEILQMVWAKNDEMCYRCSHLWLQTTSVSVPCRTSWISSTFQEKIDPTQLVVIVVLNITSLCPPWGFTACCLCVTTPTCCPACCCRGWPAAFTDEAHHEKDWRGSGIKARAKKFRHSCSNIFLESWKSQDYTVC